MKIDRYLNNFPCFFVILILKGLGTGINCFFVETPSNLFSNFWMMHPLKYITWKWYNSNIIIVKYNEMNGAMKTTRAKNKRTA